MALRFAFTRVSKPFFGLQNQVLRVLFSSFPNHQVVGLPALSPTMTTGTISKWLVKKGDTFTPGSLICQVETDKATVDFEAQDEGVIAKLLVPEGKSEIGIGDPIMVVVQNPSDVEAFQDFEVSKNEKKESAPKSEPKPIEQPQPVKAPQPQVQAPPQAQAKAPPQPKTQAPSQPQTPPKEENQTSAPKAPTSVATTTSSTKSYYSIEKWGRSIENGALAFSLAKQQHAYIKKYGSTLQKPLTLPKEQK